MFFFENILKRLSKSKYNSHIILKGGLLLASIIGSDDRTTKDMDATVKGIPLEKDKVNEIIQEILNVEMDDGISFEIVSVKDIINDNIDDGFKTNILAKMDGIRTFLTIELTTGDSITPREMEYHYNCIFEDKKILILAYTLETVLAEKFHAIVTRGLLNTRMKDFYDIYVLLNNNKEKIDFNNLTSAIQNTFRRRETDIELTKIKSDLKEMISDEDLIKLWKNYQKTATYASGIDYKSLYSTINIIIDILERELTTV